MEEETTERSGLSRKVAGLPTKPGVYLHKDAEGTVLYVGKAKNLRNRVRAYFQENRPSDARMRVLTRKIADVDVIVTDTEAEALLLENNLIKEHQPRYNILLKDDKSYPYIRITREEYPRVFKTRRVVRDGSKYFGPYTDGTYLYYLIKTIRSIFPLRTCELPLTEETIAAGKYKVCLEYHIKKCEGPCENLISRDQYMNHVRQAQQILSGRTRELERQMESRMFALAEELRFEEAAIVRQRLEKLREYTAKQKVMSADSADRDVFALARIGPTACTLVFTIRDGNLVGKRHFFITNSADRTDEELIQTTLERWYVEQEQIPPEVLIPCELADADMISNFLAAKAERKVELIIPQIGDKRKLLSMAETNADYLLRELLVQQAQKDQSMPRSVLSLQRDLRLDHLPRRIECFDNSHMQGGEYVSSMVVFVDGKPKKSEYRTFKLKYVDSNDDFAAMREVITRRYGGSLKDVPLPDLCIIDGGKGQVSAAMEALRHLNMEGQFPVIGLAKRLEEIVIPGKAEPTILPRASSTLRLLQRARDEAHRVAISYHRKLRDKRTLQSEITNVEGVGPKTATKLLVRFGSVEGIRAATIEQLANEVGSTLAQRIHQRFHP